MKEKKKGKMFLVTNEPDDHNDENRAKGERLRRAKVPRDRIQHTPHQKQWHRENRGRQDDIPHPAGAPNPLEEPRGHIACHKRRDGVEDHKGGLHGATVVGVVQTNASEQKNPRPDAQELSSHPEDRAQDGLVGRKTEYVAVDELPAIILSVCEGEWNEMRMEERRRTKKKKEEKEFPPSGS